jgi:hypothetical protein
MSTLFLAYVIIKFSLQNCNDRLVSIWKELVTYFKHYPGPRMDELRTLL